MRNWYFGANAGLSFATTQPAAVSGSAMNTYEASASISDAKGNLLFYTNSVSIWNRNHQLMANATNLGGNESATQGAVIVPDPANAQRYYVFLAPSVDVQATVGGLRYVLVDMTAQGGLGEAGPITTVFAGRGAEKLTAVLHRNGRDTWIIVHDFPGNTFRAYLLSSSGVSAAPVLSSIGAEQSGGGGNFNTNNAVGYLRASPDGSKLAMAQRNTVFELFDFDNAAGSISNLVTLGQPFGDCYGLEFSPDGTRLYGSTFAGYSIYQWNLTAASPAAIVASAVRVAATGDYAAALAKGPDGKIYVCVGDKPYLGVITNPNTLGAACGYVEIGVPLGNQRNRYGLPNFPNAYATTSTLATAAAQPLAQVAIYPNPAHDRLWVSVPAALGRQALTVTIFNSLGQRVLKQPLVVTGRDAQLPLPRLVNGIYTVQLVAPSGESVRQKVVIQ